MLAIIQIIEKHFNYTIDFGLDKFFQIYYYLDERKERRIISMNKVNNYICK